MQSDWTVRRVYLYAVCLVSLMVMLFTVSSLVGTVASQIYRFQQGLRVTMIQQVATLLAAGTVYVLHWRRARDEEKS